MVAPVTPPGYFFIMDMETQRTSWVTDANAALLTDLYEFTMAHAYHEEKMNDTAVFDLFVRRLPEERNFLLAAGLDDVLHFLENLSFSAEAIDYLQNQALFAGADLGYLANFRFTGNVNAVPEGTPVFPNEPILEVEAPIAQAQILETFLLNQVTFQTLAASKAARVVAAAEGTTVVDFGLRRMHGTDAGMKAARAFAIAGVAATSNVLAGQVYGIPISGTMAHSYIQAHQNEEDAFRAFIRTFPEAVLLVDTYDTIEGVKKVIRLAREMGDHFKGKAIRLDSGDLDALSRAARKLLDGAGLSRVSIFASSSLDEYEISRLRRQGAPITGYGVGTNMGVSTDAPSLDTVYKLVSYGGRGRTKFSTAKPILPAKKQVYRHVHNGRMTGDVISSDQEHMEGTPLLHPVMIEGKRLPPSRKSLREIRKHAAECMASLPQDLLALEKADPPFPVKISARLREEHEELRRNLA